MKKRLCGLALLLLLSLALPLTLTACNNADTPNAPDEPGPLVPMSSTLVDRFPSGGGTVHADFIALRDEDKPLSVFWSDGSNASLAAAVFDSDGNQIAASNSNDFTAPVRAGERYTVAVNATAGGEVRIAIIDSQRQDRDMLPFPTRLMGTDLPALPDVDPTSDPLEAWRIEYEMNDDGKFIFGNNPEQLSPPDLNVINMRKDNMAGNYFFTFSHSNQRIFRAGYEYHYFGYRLVNHGDEDMVVTVWNRGIQYDGEWLGARAWNDLYNLAFELPDDYFVDPDGKPTLENTTWYYRGQDFHQASPKYHPIVAFEPETLVVPSGEYLWIFGGTTPDNFNNFNVGGTADLKMPAGCMNGHVRFEITAGENISGEFIFYTDAALLTTDMPAQGYVILRPETSDISYFEQYKGWDNYWRIEADFEWTVNDNTPSQNLPVYYYNYVDSRAGGRGREPYGAHNVRRQRVPRTGAQDRWHNAISQHIADNAVGVDMSTFFDVDTEGNPIFVDALHYDGGGEIANLGNWMIVYQDNFTFNNAGDRPRTFNIYKRGNFIIGTMARDRNGDVLHADLYVAPLAHVSHWVLESVGHGPNFIFDNFVEHPAGSDEWWPIINGRPYFEIRQSGERNRVASITVPPNSVEQITVEYFILANSSGGINHWIELAD
ncbi:MAG: hypothetical protein FWE06_09915 [Oscillospiraceae bacterium]|nr:hypothetical protein [Oscillospiraceae bacterium]